MSANIDVSSAKASRQAWVSVGAPVLALVLVVAVAAFAVFIGFAREQNREFTESSRRLVSNTIDGRERALAQLTLDYANWNDAYRAISVHWNGAWVRGNFYSSVVDGFVIFRADGSVRYAWFADAYQDETTRLSNGLVRAAQAVPQLRRLMGAPNKAGTVRHAMVALDGRLLALIAVAPIAPEDDAARIARATDAQTDYLVTLQTLEPAEIADLGRSLNLRDIAFEPSVRGVENQRVSQPLVGADGATIGELQWHDDKPGDRAFAAQITPFVLGLLLVGALTIFVARSLVLRQVTAAARARAALESSRHKSEFISMMSHELRTPLNAIIGYAELIQEEGAHQPQYQAVRDDAECILVAARHLHQLFNDVLDQSRIDAGHLRLRRERVLVSELLADIEDLLAPMARANGNTLTFAAEHPTMSLVADHQRVRQCLLNLVGNALKFTKNGAVSLRARHAVRDSVQCVTFDVIDTGIGISRESTVDVFEPFTQAEAIQLTYGGAGLGLSISRKLARAMGGDISFVSEVGKGSCFSLNLPVSGSETSADTSSIEDAAIA